MDSNTNSSSKILKYIVVFFSGLLVLQGILVVTQDFWLAVTDEEINQSAYRIIESPIEVEHLWTQENLFSFYGSKGGLLLDSIDESVYFLSRFEKDDIYGLSLIKFDLHSGEVIWRAIDNRPGPFGEPRVSGLMTNANKIFVSFYGTQSISGETLTGAAKLGAYDIHGNSLWLRSIGGARSITTIVATDTTISADGNFSSKYYMFDANSGEILNTISKDNGNFIWLIEEGIKYEQKDLLIQAVKSSSEKVLWQNSINEQIYMSPEFSDDYIVLRTNEAHFLGTVVTLNRESGQTVWEYPDVLSNIAVDNSVVYFLTKDMQLIGKDIENGQTLVNIAFGPNAAIDSENNVYQVTASDNTIVIYFGGTDQLSAFRSAREIWEPATAGPSSWLIR